MLRVPSDEVCGHRRLPADLREAHRTGHLQRGALPLTPALPLSPTHTPPLQVDDSNASIGKRYARTDEIGIPFAITVDKGTAKDNMVTVRDRDTCAQIRVAVAEVVELVRCSTHARVHLLAITVC